jgi:hypothetical protein
MKPEPMALATGFDFATLFPDSTRGWRLWLRKNTSISRLGGLFPGFGPRRVR